MCEILSGKMDFATRIKMGMSHFIPQITEGQQATSQINGVYYARRAGIRGSYGRRLSTTTCLLTFALEKRNDGALFLRKVSVTVIP